MPTAITRADGDDVSSLSDAYQEAVTAWGEKMAQARKEKKVDEVRKQHPAFEYYPKFEKLAAGGNNEALLWMASHLQDKLLDKDKEKAACSAKKLEMFTKLVKESAGEDWTDYLVRGISTQSKWLTDEQSDKLLLVGR